MPELPENKSRTNCGSRLRPLPSSGEHDSGIAAFTQYIGFLYLVHVHPSHTVHFCTGTTLWVYFMICMAEV